MSNRHFGRNLQLLASTSVVALALIAAPVSLRVLPNAPAWHLETPSQGSPVLDAFLDKGMEFDADIARRMALARLGLSQTMTYTSPLLLTLSEARANDGDGGEGEGGEGGSGGGGESGDSGEAEGTSSPSSSESSEAESSDSAGGSFGDVEQVGPSLSQDEEAAAITAGWQ